MKKSITALVIAALTFLNIPLLSSCKNADPYDPYEGMVRVPNGAGGEMWITVLDGIEVSNFSSGDFYTDGRYIDYRGEEYTALRGIDVSEHQKEIDWAAVKEDGVEFAIIRAGYRGYGSGTLNEDMYFRQNMEGALGAGLKVGVYFFSQAVNTYEARQEAKYMLELIEGYAISLPVFYDWETVSNVGETRTENVTGSSMTDFALAFCEVIGDAGYEPGVYFYRSLGYMGYELDRLAGLVFWSAAVGEYPDFYYAHSVWQYSFTGRVQGIEPDTDLNIYFERVSLGE